MPRTPFSREIGGVALKQEVAGRLWSNRCACVYARVQGVRVSMHVCRVCVWGVRVSMHVCGVCVYLCTCAGCVCGGVCVYARVQGVCVWGGALRACGFGHACPCTHACVHTCVQRVREWAQRGRVRACLQGGGQLYL